ncbi:MAG TPA: hypothetical protein VLC91_00085 [Spongiibacteraceae bacterium]|nr:hypothetical protein [Spongiibacteraceae bacterium]
MNFSVSSKFHLESDCTDYMVCKMVVEGKASYSAWYRDTCLGQRTNATDAKRLCSDHAHRVELAAAPA